MDHPVKSLYRQIKNGEISQEEAAKQIRQFLMQIPAMTNTSLADQLKGDLREKVADLLNVPAEHVSTGTELAEFGLDPVLLADLADWLNQRYQLELTPGLILEQRNLHGLAVYILAEHRDATSPVEKRSVVPVEESKLRIMAANYLKHQLSSVLQAPADRLDLDAPLEDYGMDSVMVMKLTAQLEKNFGPLSKTLFYEYQTIGELTGYFIKYHREALVNLLGLKEEAVKEEAAAKADHAQPPLPFTKAEKRGRQKKNEAKTAQRDGIAIIGLAGRYPGAKNIREFWKNLQEGKDCITEISPDRWDHRLYFDPDKHKPGKTYSKWGGFIDGVDRFDPLFFNISPREAEVLDPQERLFLECVYETIEDAGYTRESLRSDQEGSYGGKVGVFVGVMYEEYSLYGAQEQLKGNPVALGSNISSIANRVSYFFNFTGPSMAINTMCSSSLTALHLACQSLMRGECELAVAGGVNLSIHPNKYLLLGQGKFASSKGRCESFGAGGDGYVPGEGVGAVLLKPLSRAIADRDNIYGVIKGTAINHGGKTNGYTVPNPNAQAEVISRALQEAGIHPRTVSCLEAHGTGTALGDPIEITGLSKAFGALTEDQQFCSIGSVKSNIGHCESAAGIAGLTKVLLQMKYGQLVPSLHSDVLNPHIDFSRTPFVVQRSLQEWKRPVLNLDGEEKEYPRRAGISAFGAGGSNAHIVVEEYIREERTEHNHATGPVHPALIVLSAKDDEALRRRVRQLLDAMEEQPFADSDLADLAYTLQVGREAMEERLAFTAATVREMKEKLKRFLDGRVESGGVFRGGANSGKELLSALAADEELETIIEMWLQKGKYDQLLQWWVKGLNLDWNLLYPGDRPYRISLPAYPFAGQICWLPETIRGDEVKTRLNATPEREEPGIQCLYLPVWEEQAAPERAEAHRHDTVVIVYQESSAAFKQTIVDHYRRNASAGRIVQILLDRESKKRSDDHWQCAFDDPQALEACLNEAGAIDCLYFIAEFRNADEQIDFHDLAQSQQRNELPLLRIVKLLQARQDDTPVDCYFLTQDNYTIGGKPAHPYGGGVTGLAYAVAQGDHRMRVRNIDLSAEDMGDAEKQNQVLRMILEEPPSHRGEVIKMQRGRRYRQAFLEMDSASRMKTEGLRNGGVYVIAGGSGTVGRAITRYLIAEYRARVIWIGRTPEDSDAIKEKLAEFAGLGSVPAYIRADVTDPRQMRQAVKRIKEQHSVINGAIFSGVVFSFENSLRQTTENEFLEILNVKTIGGILFYTAFQDEPLDFMLYFSSGQAYSFSGAARFSAYATGIAFSDAFVRSLRNKAPFPVGTINWGFWQDSVQGTFLDGKTRALQDDEGFACFARVAGLLREGLLNQSLCLKPSPSLKGLMNLKKEKAVVNAPVTRPLPGSLYGRLESGKHAEDPLIDGALAKQMEEWVAKLLFVQLSTLGLPPKGMPVTAADLLQKGKIAGKYERWLAECLRILETYGYLCSEAGQMIVLADHDAGKREQVWKEWEPFMASCSGNLDWRAQTLLLDACLRKLPDILTGRTPATEVLFANASMESVEGIYKNNTVADYFNHVLADVVADYIRQRLSQNPLDRIRILEAGAGTGGTSAVVLDRIKEWADRLEYCYTDISKSFLLFAQEKYGPDYPCLTFKTWNIEQPVSAAGIESGAYDILIASNVLHATRDIRQTIRRIKAALKSNGLLLLNEMTRKHLFATVTFGLLDGWWLFEDEHLRIPGSPLIGREEWQTVLEEEGFRQIGFPARQGAQNGQQIIVAESDGWVRLPMDDAEPEAEEVLTEETASAALPEAGQAVEEKRPGERLDVYVRKLIIRQLSGVLKVPQEQISASRPFSEYGVDSILGVSFVNQLNAALGINLNSAILFDYTTVDRLSEHITQMYRNHLEQQIRAESGAERRREKTAASLAVNREKRGQQLKAAKVSEFADGSSIGSGAIAVIGMAGQFPDAPDLDAFWNNLANGHDAVRELPAAYLDQRRYYDRDKQPGKTYCKWGGVLAEKNAFDPLFFNISPREAASMSPHQRLILQESWKALEDAGYNPKKLAGMPVGVFIGAEPANYYHESFTGSSDAIVASRLSYYLNLTGPALVVNTGCSSSAAAIHLACESLRRGESSMAVVGGVYAKLDETSLIALSGIEMISPTGKCFTFDERADGTVLSEGVGIVVLKPLHQAEADGDPIYGVIVGSGMNQDGASNGITAPNGLAQEQLVTEVYQKYAIDPEDISYVEAHGTGTKLGDPVEVNALIRAFRRFTSKGEFCAIGSTKSNIGHTGAAAGVIGLIRVLLSMKHRQIPALINFQKLNPLIALKESPFYVNTETVKWMSPAGRPLMAAVNSFGHSGTNVHLVVQEYRPERTPADDAASPVLIPLSARKEDRLHAYAEKLLDFLNRQDTGGAAQPFSLASLACTLQTGREAMKERVVFLVDDPADLRAALADFLAGKSRNGVWRGQYRKGADAAGLFDGDDEDLQETIRKWAAKGKLAKIAELWAQGVDVNWEWLYGENKPLRIHAPSYPFAREYYGIAEKRGEAKRTTSATEHSVSLHPLLHENTSGLQGIQFTSTFTGREFFLEDHQVKGKRMLPGVAYLEMAREAVKWAARGECGDEMGIHLKNIVWSRPVVVEEEPEKVQITLFPEEDETITYEIHGDSGKEAYHRGSAVLKMIEVVPTLDLPALKRECEESVLSGGDCYEAFRAIGLEYGPGHQGISEIYRGQDRVLAKLALPDEARETLESFVLHPGLMDSAVQAALGLMAKKGEIQPVIPFALEELVVYRKCTSEMWSYIRHSEGSKAEDRLLKLDIDLCDEQGTVCARMRGLSLRVLEGEPWGTKESASAESLLLRPVWQEQPVEGEAGASVSANRLVLFCGFADTEMISEQMKGADFRILQSGETRIEHQFRDYAGQLLQILQSLFHERARQKVMLQLVVPAEESAQTLSGLAGMLKSARLENPHFCGQLIEVDSLQGIAGILEENSRRPDDLHLRHEAGKRLVAGWSPIEADGENAQMPWREGGVYLITGGGGGLGLLFAGEIARQLNNAVIILAGRSPLTGEMEAKLDEIRSPGIRVAYQRADVTDREAVNRLVNAIRNEHGTLHGIIHSAGVLRDSRIRHKTEEELNEVMAPKTLGLVNLDLATKDIPLDFFICFSSGSAVWGSAGQADYAAANGFMDSYAKWRASLVTRKERHGRTLSINWPYWQGGGMRIGAATKLMMQQAGMMPMTNESGIRAFYQCWSSGSGRVLVMAGDTMRIRQRMLSPEAGPDAARQKELPKSAERPGEERPGDLRERVQFALLQVVSRLIHVRMEELDADTGLDEYGFDSITFSELANELNRRYKLELMPTLFFEHTTLNELAGYLCEEYGDILAPRFASAVKNEATETGKPVGSEEITEKKPSLPLQKEKVRRQQKSESKDASRRELYDEGIAIVGMSGVFPGARDLDEFWNNLVNGRDCITEIPKERWDWREYYGDPAKEADKTNIKWGGFIEGVDEFDPLFFGISPRQAELMDPQQRLLMTCCWKAIEDAGYSAQSLSGTKTGIFVGMGHSGYAGVIKQAGAALEGYSATGMATAMGPNRMSYFLNVHGPSEPVDTACSSSLVAIDRAVNAIKNGDCDAAIAGGVNTILTPDLYISFSKANMLSADGRCKTFSDKADGYVRGEGVGMIFLKRLKDAEKAGDHIYGVIRATAVNHGGRANSLTAPNPKAQAELLVTAYRKAGIDPRTVTYIEAHGTGTELGDPIEINGLKAAFAELYADWGVEQPNRPHCGLGSVKSNIGHLELAAGIAGVIKLLLQLKHKMLVKSLHTDVINPYIRLQNSPFYIVRENREWTALKDASGNDIPRRAGVSSFGFGGSNAHVVIEEYIPHADEPTSGEESQVPVMILLSAKDQTRLKEQVQNLWTAIRQGKYNDASLRDMAYTLQVGRDAMEERLALLASSLRELEEKLKAWLEGTREIDGLYTGRVIKKGQLAALQADEDFEATVDRWLEKGKYGKLLSMWVQGLNVDWNRLYKGQKPKRISLPTYPFARERYWVTGANNPSTVESLRPPAREKEKVKKILVKDWRENSPDQKEETDAGTVIMLATPATMKIAEPWLREAALQVVPVVHDSVASSAAVVTDYYDSHAGEQLYHQIKKKVDQPQFLGVIDVTAYDEQYEQSEAIEAGKITFLQKLIEHHRHAGWKLMQVTCRLQSWQVEKPTLQGARLSGLYRMLGAEYPQIQVIALDSDCAAHEYEELAEQIRNEFFRSQEGNLIECCYRGGRRFTPAFKEVEPQPFAPSFHERDVILITGGSRGIGAAVAEQVVRRGVKHLVIMGREALPEQGEWEHLPETGDNSEQAEKIRRLKALADQGVKLHYANTSLTDLPGLQAMVAEVRRKLGPITGVFHCAGIRGRNPAFFKKTIAEIEAVCEPKIQGLVNLHKALESEPLSFFLLFSSVAAASPILAAGQSDYAMANAYMDYYAAYQAGAGQSWFKSVQWPAWKETGMAAGGMDTPVYRETGLLSHSTADGLQLLDDVQSLPETVCLPCVVDPQRFSGDKLLRQERLPAVPRSVQAAQGRVDAGEKAPASPSQLRAEIVRWLQHVFRSELKLAHTRLDEHKPFADYGVDSILIAQIVQTMQEKTGKPLPPSLLLEYGTIADLADYFAEHHGDAWQPAAQAIRDESVESGEEIPSVSLQPESVQPPASGSAPEPEEEIAIVGIACRFPDAPSKEAYWELLTQGKCAIRPVPEERWIPKNGRVDYGGWIEGIDRFDPAFFHISESDAAVMDPQARLLLEESLNAIFDAGYEPNELRGQSVGVYIGGRSQPLAPADAVLASANPILGIGQNYLAANLSKFFDFRGPSLVVDTACSSGITGLLLAADALRGKRIDMALVGAVSLLTGPLAHDVFAARNILSGNGRFEIFDKQSDGEVLGEGIGVVFVKRLSDAVRDGNYIYGIIKGIAVNNDGRTLGPGSPSLQAQKQVMEAALAMSGKRPDEIGYIEVNGGGTPIMDTIEIKALSDVYALGNREWGPCCLGAVKPNIGHLLLASGMAGLIRCLLSVRYGKIPPFLSANDPFEYYDFSRSRIRFNRETEDWRPPSGQKRTAALNSFPDGGTNYHVIVEEFVPERDFRQKRFPKAAPALQKVRVGVSSGREKPAEAETVSRHRRPVRNVWGEIR